MSEIYEVRTRIPRYFTQQTFVRSGGNAVIRMAGLKGVVEAFKSLTTDDLNFILATYSLYTPQEEVIEEPVINQSNANEFKVPVVTFEDEYISPLLTTTRNPKRKKSNKK